MSRPLRFAIVLCLRRPGDHHEHRANVAATATAAAQGDRERFVGAWRLAWMEEPGPDGKIHRTTDCKGLLMFTRDGRMSVQIHVPSESQSSVSNDYTRTDTRPPSAPMR